MLITMISIHFHPATLLCHLDIITLTVLFNKFSLKDSHLRSTIDQRHCNITCNTLTKISVENNVSYIVCTNCKLQKGSCILECQLIILSICYCKGSIVVISAHLCLLPSGDICIDCLSLNIGRRARWISSHELASGEACSSIREFSACASASCSELKACSTIVDSDLIASFPLTVLSRSVKDCLTVCAIHRSSEDNCLHCYLWRLFRHLLAASRGESYRRGCKY